MKSPKKKKEPEKKTESPAFFGKKKDDESFFQRKEDAGEKKEMEVKKEEEDEEKEIQTKAEGTSGGHTAKSGGNPGVKPGGAAGKSLPPSTQSQMESAFGTGFKEVNIHTDEEAAEKSRELEAQAFTYGQDIYFNKGKFKPGTIEGDALLAHELAHTLQQKDETNVGQDFEEQAEQEADEAAIEYVQGRKVKNLSGAGKLKALKKSRGKGLRIQRCKDKPEKGPTPAPTPKDAGTPDPNEAMRNQVAGVRSLKVEEYKTRLAGEIGDLQLRFKKRKEHLDEKSPLVKGDQKTIVDGMIARGTGWEAKPMADWTNTEIDTAISQEKADLKKLDRNKNTDDVIGKFISALEQVRMRKTQIAEEEVEFKRFDTQFMDPQVITLCAAIPHATITPADVKALISQETGDMTNTAVAGIENKKKGITSERENKNYVGLGQQNEIARDEGLGWAKGKNSEIAVTEGTDPRKDPATAIKLTAGYLGRLSDLLWSALPANKPGPAEFKKMLFAAYNGGAQTIANAAKDFLKGTPGNYTWNDIKSYLKWNGKKTDPKTTEIRNYVEFITQRTTPAP